MTLTCCVIDQDEQEGRKYVKLFPGDPCPQEEPEEMPPMRRDHLLPVSVEVETSTAALLQFYEAVKEDAVELEPHMQQDPVVPLGCMSCYSISVDVVVSVTSPICLKATSRVISREIEWLGCGNQLPAPSLYDNPSTSDLRLLEQSHVKLAAALCPGATVCKSHPLLFTANHTKVVLSEESDTQAVQQQICAINESLEALHVSRGAVETDIPHIRLFMASKRYHVEPVIVPFSGQLTLRALVVREGSKASRTYLAHGTEVSFWALDTATRAVSWAGSIVLQNKRSHQRTLASKQPATSS